MLVEKSITSVDGKIMNTSKYTCDMCKNLIKKQERFLVSTTRKGGDTSKKKWDLCENCMKIIEKNVNLWYDRIVNKK